MAKDYEDGWCVVEQMDSTLHCLSEVIAEDIEGYLDSLGGASEGVNPADGADSRRILSGTLGPVAHMLSMGK